MKVRLNDPINWNNKVTTINQLEKQGLITFTKIDKFGNKEITKYFADIKSTDGSIPCFEINKLAYDSKTKTRSEVLKNFD